MRTHLGHIQRSILAALRNGDALYCVSGSRWTLGARRIERDPCVSLWIRGYVMQGAIEEIEGGYRQGYTLTEKGKTA